MAKSQRPVVMDKLSSSANCRFSSIIDHIIQSNLWVFHNQIGQPRINTPENGKQSQYLQHADEPTA
jgi:hypothetical protein